MMKFLSGHIISERVLEKNPERTPLKVVFFLILLLLALRQKKSTYRKFHNNKKNCIQQQQSTMENNRAEVHEYMNGWMDGAGREREERRDEKLEVF
jgi:membrane protein implicated in regulation of membrane protease activity